jgi:membrane protein required for colicin V production
MNLPVIDIIFILLMLLLVVRCTLRGFVLELMSMAAVVLGLVGAFILHKNGGLLIREKYFPTLKIIPELLAFLAIFLIIFVVIKILEHILSDIIRRINFGGVDRFLGFIFGLVEGIILISLILLILSIQPLFNAEPLLERSFFAQFILPIINGENPAPSSIPLVPLPAESVGMAKSAAINTIGNGGLMACFHV